MTIADILNNSDFDDVSSQEDSTDPLATQNLELVVYMEGGIALVTLSSPLKVNN
jgi:hypothetical protein